MLGSEVTTRLPTVFRPPADHATCECLANDVLGDQRHAHLAATVFRWPTLSATPTTGGISHPESANGPALRLLDSHLPEWLQNAQRCALTQDCVVLHPGG